MNSTSNLSELILSLEHDMNINMASINSQLSSITTTISSLTVKVSDVVSTCESLKENNEKLSKSNSLLQNKVNQLESVIDNLENQSRCSNLIFGGLEGSADETWSTSLDVKAYKNTPTEPIGYEEEEMKSICLTRNGEQQFYDGYVGSDENDDSRALKITLFLEQALNLTLFLTSRDMPPGVALYPAQAYIIEKRCRYLLCFITKDFDRSPSCQFIVRYVNHLAPDSEGKKKKIIPMIIDSQAKVPNIMQPLMHVDFSNSEVEQYSQHKHWNQLKESLLELEDYSEASRKLKKSMSVQPINFVKPQTYRRSISEQTDQSKRSVSVCRFGIGQEETKNEVYKIVRTPSDDSQAECGELSQATGGPNPIDSSLCTGVHEIDIQSVVRFRIRRETEV